VSATNADDGSGSKGSCSESKGEKAGGEAQPGSKAKGSGRWGSDAEGKTSDENGGGRREKKLDEDASEQGE
jgi:hypothetical protein